MSKRLSKKTQGVNQQVFVTTNIDETNDTTYPAFLANAPLAEIGVYDSANAKHTDAITASESFFICQKVTGGTKRSQLLKFSDVTVRKQSDVAAVKCKYFLGWNGASGSLNNPTLATGQEFEFVVIETTEGNQPFPKWNYNYVTKVNDVAMDIVQNLAKQVNDVDSLLYRNVDPLVVAKVKADATYSDYAIGAGGTLTATNGSDTLVTAVGTINFVVGDYVSLSPGAAATDSVGDIYKIIANPDANTWQLNRIYTGATTVFTETNIETNDYVQKAATFVQVGLELTAVNTDEHFKLAVRGNLVDATVTFSAYTPGNGTFDQVVALESEGTTFDGETTKNTEFASKYGTADKFAVSGATYNYYMIEYSQTSDEIAGFGKGKVKGFIIIACNAANAAQETYFDALF